MTIGDGFKFGLGFLACYALFKMIAFVCQLAFMFFMVGWFTPVM